MVNDRKEKLRKLGAEVLAEALLELASRDGMAEALLKRLLAPAGSAKSRIEGQLKSLYRGDRYYDWRSVDVLASKLHMILSDISSSIQDPELGVDLVLRFYEADAAVFGRCDDSDGDIGDIYRIEAPELFQRYAKGLTDKEGLLARLRILIASDEYGVRDNLLNYAHEWLTEPEMRSFAEDNLACALADSDPHRRFHWSSMAETMASFLNDGALFEHIRCATSETLGAAARADMAEVHLAGGDHARALEMLDQVAADDLFQLGRRDQLRLKIYQQTGRKADAETVAWGIFNRCPDMAGLDRLLEVIGPSRREEVIAREVERIQASSAFSLIDADFLFQTDNAARCAQYVEQHAGQIDGRDYSYLPGLARALKSQGHLLAATIIFRALLVSLLERGAAKAYRHGGVYLRQLAKLAPLIVDWKALEKHEAFYQHLQAKHGRKRSFWAQVDDAES